MKNRTYLIIALSFICIFGHAQTDVEVLFRTGHINKITATAISPDSRMLATVDASNLIVIWDLNTRQQKYAINGMEDEISIIMFSSDGKYLIGAGSNIDGFGNELIGRAKNRSIKFWDAKTGKELHSTALDNKIYFMDYTHDGKLVTFETGTMGCPVFYRDPENGEKLAKQKVSGFLPVPENYAFSPDGKLLAIASTSGAAKGKTIAKQMAKDILFGTKELEKSGYLLIQDLETDKLIENIHIGHDDGMLTGKNTRQMKFTSDGKYLIMAGVYPEENIKVLNTETMEFKHNMTTEHPVDGLDISKDNKYFYTTNQSKNEILKWSIGGWNIVERIETRTPVSDIKFSPDGKYFVTVGGSEYTKTNELRLWDYKTGKNIGKFEEMIPFVTGAVFDKKNMIVGTSDGQVQIINLQNAEIVNNFDIGNGETRVGISSNGKYIVTSAIDRNEFKMEGMTMFCPQTSKIWSTTDYALVKEIPGFAQTIVSPANQQCLAIKWYVLRSELCILDIETGNTIISDKIVGNQTFFDFSDDGQYFIGTKQGLIGQNIGVWETSTLKNKFRARNFDVKGGQRVTTMKFTPGGNKILCGIGHLQKYNYGLLREWELSSGKPARTFLSIENGAVFTAVYSPDGKYLVCGIVYEDRSNAVKIFDVATAQLADTMQNVGLPFAFSNDGNYMLAYGSETMKQLNIIDLKAKKVNLRYLKINEQADCILLTNDNYYKITQNAYKAVSFRKDDKTYPFEQFDVIYHRPDIVAKQLPYSDDKIVDYYHRIYQKRLQKLNLNENKLDKTFHIPQINVKTDIPITTNQKHIDIEIAANDTKYPIERLNIWINDVPVYASKGKQLQSNQSINKVVSLELSSGENKIQISVTNNKGVSSVKTTNYVTCTAPKSSNNLYILAIGVSDYDDNEFDLDFAAKDASDMVNLFSRRKGFDNIYVKKIFDKEATRENIIGAHKFLDQSKVDDQVILFISGHGLLNENLDYFYATRDIEFRKPTGRGLPFEEVEKLLDGIGARQKIMFVDACHSGEIDKESVEFSDVAIASSDNVKQKGFKPIGNVETSVGLANSFELMKAMFADLRRGSGATTISSAGGAEFSYESDEWKNGVFSYSIIEGIESMKADKNNDSKIHVSELREFVGNRVRELTNGKQSPTFRSENLEFDYVIW